jgi:ketosteroid isomerase-like protein
VSAPDPAPTEVVRRILDAWNRGDEPADLGLIADDVEYVNPPYAIEPGTRRGIGGWRQAMGLVTGSFDPLRIEVQRIVEASDCVAVLVVFHTRGRASGAETQRDQGYVFTVREGRVTRFEWFLGHRDALIAAGLPPE